MKPSPLATSASRVDGRARAMRTLSWRLTRSALPRRKERRLVGANPRMRSKSVRYALPRGSRPSRQPIHFGCRPWSLLSATLRNAPNTACLPSLPQLNAAMPFLTNRLFLDYEVVHPVAFSNIDNDKHAKMAVVCIQNINRPRFIIHATAEYLNRLSRAHSALPNPSALPAARNQWNKFHQYALEVLQDVNCNIELQNPTPLSMSTVLVRIFSLINAEVQIPSLNVLSTS